MANFDIVSDLFMWLDDEVTDYELRESIIDCETTYNLDNVASDSNGNAQTGTNEVTLDSEANCINLPPVEIPVNHPAVEISVPVPAECITFS